MDIIIWLDTVPVCCKGIFNELSNFWNKKIVYFCSGDLDEDRKKITSDSFENDLKYSPEYVFLKEQKDQDLFLKNFIELHKNDVHILNGYRNKVIDKIIKVNPNAKTIVWAERPCPPKVKENFPGSLFHVFYAYKYRNKIKALLPLGMRGIYAYNKFGWRKEQLFPFLYLPVMNESLPEKLTNINYSDYTVRFVYLGRFTNGSKGTDVLMKAVDQLKSNNFILDMVGGYGDLADETINWANQTKNVNFLGSWPIEQACDNLYNYDVCVVPSKYEGWNVTINEALMAGIGCLVTDECVSDEMIKTSGAGKVVKADDAFELSKAMDEIMQNPKIINEWKKNAYNYRNKMTARICAKYFIDVVNYLFVNPDSERPKAPWLEK